MEYQNNYVTEITPATTKWTAKVIVAGKHSPKQARYNSGRYQYVDFMDLQGSMVTATIYGGDISALGDQLILGKTYNMSDAIVKKNNPAYKFSKGDFNWTLTGKTKIEQLDEENLEFLFSQTQITPFDRFQNHMDQNDTINVIAIVLDIHQEKKVHGYNGHQTLIQEVLLMNKDFQTIFLTLWDSFVERECLALQQLVHDKPTVWITNLKVASYNGLNLSTKNDSSFFINSHIAELLRYKNWTELNIDKINANNPENRLSSFMAPTFPPADPNDFSTIHSMLTAIPSINKKFFWLKAR